MGFYELKDDNTCERSFWDSKAGLGREFQISALDQNKSYSVRIRFSNKSSLRKLFNSSLLILTTIKQVWEEENTVKKNTEKKKIFLQKKIL